MHWLFFHVKNVSNSVNKLSTSLKRSLETIQSKPISSSSSNIKISKASIPDVKNIASKSTSQKNLSVTSKAGSSKLVMDLQLFGAKKVTKGVDQAKSGIKSNYKGYVKGNPGEKPANFAPKGAGKNAAFREAKRASGVPVSQQPFDIVNPGIGNNGKPVVGGGIDYHFVDKNGNKVVIRQHNEHKYIDDPTQNRGTHFNDINGNHYDY